MNKSNIRNFSIIAHIDHGKSTLADRVLELTGALDKRQIKEQTLDSMDIERERGITIKLNTANLKYTFENEEYVLNLIDTPGHVDFSYEVSRSLAACDGAILVVDAAQGVEAQTLANFYLALDSDLVIIPVINKIDLPNADIPKVKEELKKIFGFKEEEIILTSGKTGVGVKELIEEVIKKIPAPKINYEAKTRALVFDSFYDEYKGVIVSLKVVEGSINKKDKIKFMASNEVYEVDKLGVNTPTPVYKDELKSGEVGWITASIKSTNASLVGDTITTIRSEAVDPLEGYKPMKPMVYSGIYPIEPNKYEALKVALEKLKLNDSALTIEPETSDALGFGFRCGFLGLLHLDVSKERIKREFNIDIIITSPSVIYKVTKTNGEVIYIDSPNKMPDKETIKNIEEPFVRTNIFVPTEYIGSIMNLCNEKRGIFSSTEYIDEKRVNIHYDLPLSEIVYDFFDKLKSYTKGYASFDYDFLGYIESNLVKMDILLNGEKVDALSSIVHKDFAYDRGKKTVKNLREIIPRQMFQVPIQAAIGNKIIARETISALRKNVLAKCYGGDISRKRKLLEKQKAGKKKMKMIGKVELPSEAFLAVLKEND